MLGYTQSNNDVYIFFEDDDIERLGREKIQGTYFNIKDPKKIGLLEASVNDEINYLTKTSTDRDESGFWNWFFIEMRLSVYELFKERRSQELHEGYRHICLRDVSQPETLNFFDQINYEQLKQWQSQLSQP